MASIVNDSYSCASGGSIAAGRHVIPVFSQRELSPSSKFWAQWNRKQIVYRNGYFYAGWTDSVGATGITKQHAVTGATEHFTLKAGLGTANGHDSCVIAFLPDGRILATWANHNELQHRRISTNPEDISSWGAESTIATTTPCSYSNLTYLSVPNKYYLSYRTGEGGGPGDRPHRCRATSDGATFDTERIWIREVDQRPYVLVHNNGANRVDFWAMNRHPTDSTTAPFYLCHCYMLVDAAGAETFYTTAGSYLGTGNILTENMTQVYDASSVPAAPWDITYGPDGHPWVLWCKFMGAGQDDHRHMFSRWNGSAWVTAEIGAAGTRLYSAEYQADGALCFDTVDPRRVYRGVQVGSAWEMQCWTTSDNGATWAKSYDITSGSASGVKNFTPFCPKNTPVAGVVAWMQGTISMWDTFSTALKIERR